MSTKKEDVPYLPIPLPDAAVPDSVGPEAVMDFLRRNPDFFTLYPDVLQEMTAPVRWTGDTVIDMQRYVVDVLRQELDGLRDCAHEVIQTSRFNLATQTRTHAAALALIGAGSVEHLLRLVIDDLPILLDVDMVTLGLECAPDIGANGYRIRSMPLGEVDRWLGFGQDVVLMREISDDGSLFGDSADTVRSAALARLTPDWLGVHGIMAMGSRQEQAFNPGQGTELLRFLARVIELCLQRLLSNKT
jgi:uncharacterized protein YigA (DUF484 family)